MKGNLKKLLAILLALSMLFAALPAASAENVEEGRGPSVQVMLEPKYAATFNVFSGNYGYFFDYSTETAGICDCFGNVMMTGKGVDLVPLKNGMAKEMGKNEFGFLGWAILSPTGKRLTPYTGGGEMECGFDWVTGKIYNWVCAEFPEGTIRVDFNGNDPFPASYEEVSTVWDGQYAYCKNGKWGVDTLDGKHLVECKYEHLDFIDKDLCVFSQNGKCGLLRTDGTVVLSAQYDTIVCEKKASFYNTIKQDQWQLFDAAFQPILPPSGGRVRCFGEDLFGRSLNGTLELLHKDGTVFQTIRENYHRLLYSEGDHRIYGVYGKAEDGTTRCTAFDETGTILAEGDGGDIRATKDLIFLFSEEGAAVYDHSGNLLNTLEGAYTTYDSIPMVGSKDGNYAFVGKDGKLTTDFIYEDIGKTFHKGMICLCMDGKWNVFSEDGKQLLNFWMDDMEYITEDSDFVGFLVDGYGGVLRFVEEGDSLFADVANGAWYRTAADFCAERGIMSGTAAGQFSPNVTTTRPMIVSILYRLSGAEKPTGDNPFTDVKAGQWYTDAVLWAAENEIVSGYGNGKFGPDDPITREQIAVILKNYAEKSGADVSNTAALSGFPDEAKVGSWAKSAVSWAVAEGLISGSVSGGKTLLDPQGKATRAMIASIMMRFVQ